MGNVIEIPSTQEDVPMEEKYLRVAAYCRVSTDHEEQDSSIELQELRYRQMIEENPNWENVVYALQHINDVFPNPESRPNMDSCPSRFSVCISHLLNDSYLFHKEARTRASKTCPCAGNGEILARAAPADDVHRRQIRAVQFCNVSHLLHSWETDL